MREQIVINTSTQRLSVNTINLACRIGKAGAIPLAQGREGDAKTPLGEYHLRFGLYRADRLPSPNLYWPNLYWPRSDLTFRPLREDDGWCDAPDDPAYNRFIRLPYAASHERLWRDDGVYDIILVMSHNDSPPEPNLGSAVFIHVAQPDDRKTLGCVALAPDAMVQLLPNLKMGMRVIIQA